MEVYMIVNRIFKNSVFTLLFDNPDLLRELYCALEDIYLPPDVPVSINTLKNALFMGINNDISFEIGGKLIILVEHASLWSASLRKFIIYAAQMRGLCFKAPLIPTWH